MGPLFMLVLLRQFMMAMSLGWRRGMCRGGGAFFEDAPFEELSKGELCSGVLELNSALCRATYTPCISRGTVRRERSLEKHPCNKE